MSSPTRTTSTSVSVDGPDGTDGTDGTTILARTRAVAPILEEDAQRSERGRALTARAVEALRSTGVFRMSMPRSWGGPELDIATQLEIIEALSRADGSAGWCAMIGSDGGFFTAALDDGVGRALYPDLDEVTAGFIQQPVGRLDVVEGGYRLSGRWPFASGCTHADVMVAAAVPVADGEMVRTVGGLPEHRIAVLPAHDFEVVDTWHTTGLAGSGSHDVAIDGAMVPAEQTFLLDDLGGRREGALYAWPGLFVHNFTGVPLGIARGALDAAEELVADKVLRPEMRPARDEPRVRTAVARAEALVGSARSYVFDVTGDFWSTLEAGNHPSDRQRAALAGSGVHTVNGCHEAVQLLADAVGSASVHRSGPFDRRLRDLITVRQHVFAQLKSLETVGALWIEGADTNHPLLIHHVL